MTRLKLAGLQVFPAKASPEKSVASAIQMLAELTRNEIDILCLPEAWLFDTLPAKNDRISASYEIVIKTFSKWAKESGAYVVPGGIYRAVSGRIRVVSPIIAPSGEVIGEQGKIHLFRNEKNFFEADDQLRVFSLRNFNVGIMVCFDAVFPEVARSMVLKGADLLLNPSRITKNGVEPWQLYLRTRALENRIPLLGVNLAYPPDYTGGSVIIDLEKSDDNIVYPSIISLGDAKPRAVLGSVDIDAAKKLREERLNERRPKVYGLS